MSYRGERDDVFSTNRLGEVSKGLFRISGGWGNASGPGLFMLRTLFSGATTAMFMGLTGASLAAILVDTAAIPFVVTSSMGFIIGSLAFYRDSLRKAFLSLERYPRLLQLHLHANYPSSRFDLWKKDEFRSSIFNRDWKLRSMLICAWLTAQPALDQIFEEREQAVIEDERGVQPREASS